MKRIYVAEDTPEDALIAEAVLDQIPDVQVQFFNDGLDLYRAVRASAPDLLLLDIILPTLSGLAVTRLLKFHEQFAHVKIVVVSSIIDTDIVERASTMGADAFLHKPYDPDRLLEAVRSRL